MYNYSIPCCNLGSQMILNTIALEMKLPESKSYEAKDGGNFVKITQKIQIEHISFYNGRELLQRFDTAALPKSIQKEFLIRKGAEQWKGINVDILVRYEISSNIAISDQFDLTEGHAKELEHVFGGVSCKFKKDTP